MKVAIKIAKSLEFINPAEILYLKAEGSYSLIKKVNGDIIKVSKNLLVLTSQFKGCDQLQKCHRSYFANISFVNSILSVGVQKYKIQLENKEIIPLSLRFKKDFMQCLKNTY